MRYRLNVVKKSLRDQKWQIVGFGIAFFAMAALIVYIWPSYRTTVASIQLPEAVQALLGSDLAYSTAPGFVSAEYFSWIPILLIVYTIIQGTGAIAGEEGSGTIDLLMSQPITRSDHGDPEDDRGLHRRGGHWRRSGSSASSCRSRSSTSTIR